MMDDKKKPVVPPQEKIEELSDAQLSQVNGGITIPTLPSNGGITIPTISGNAKPGGVQIGQALKQTSSFTKSDDQLPSNR